ncbi:MAG: hypothetical protein ACK41C_08620 [Phenylobacterium sp.]|uniref:hypothetical protein n=1 Tax=Phenylobacterium sp. TaxID=1871053 RepID=UPI003918CCB3
MKPRVALIVLAVAVLAGVAALFGSESLKRSAAIAESTADAQAWKLDGPPCPEVTAEAFAERGLKADKAFEFNGQTFARRFGHADCNLVNARGGPPVPVCNLTAPATVVVTTAEGESFRFEPGVGHPVIVSVSGGRAQCAMADAMG